MYSNDPPRRPARLRWRTSWNYSHYSTQGERHRLTDKEQFDTICGCPQWYLHMYHCFALFSLLCGTSFIFCCSSSNCGGPESSTRCQLRNYMPADETKANGENVGTNLTTCAAFKKKTQQHCNMRENNQIHIAITETLHVPQNWKWVTEQFASLNGNDPAM